MFSLMLALLLSAPVQHALAAPDARCFAETGYCISGRIREFWEQNGGLAVFGFPTGPQQIEQIEGMTVQAQSFERNRLELHPQNSRPYDVQIGRLGADVLAEQGRNFPPQGSAPEGCRYFAETGHSLCEPFLSYWRANGLEFDGRRGASEAENLALFGLPLSEAQRETLAGGQTYTVQWFERARFEQHTRNPVTGESLPRGQQVLLGLLGNETQGRNRRSGTPEPTRVGDPRTPEPTRIPRPTEVGEPRPTEPADDRCDGGAYPAPQPPRECEPRPTPPPTREPGDPEPTRVPPPPTREPGDPEPTRVPPPPTREPGDPEPTRVPPPTREPGDPEPTRVPPPPTREPGDPEPTRVPPPPTREPGDPEPTRVPPPPTPTRPPERPRG
ncbi:MAG: hypothetical protein OHK0022_13240 [Roseiflexaceae bacterium]